MLPINEIIMEQTEECEFCNGTGFVTNIEYNSDIHQYVEAGLIKYKHPNNHDDYSGADAND